MDGTMNHAKCGCQRRANLHETENQMTARSCWHQWECAVECTVCGMQTGYRNSEEEAWAAWDQAMSGQPVLNLIGKQAFGQISDTSAEDLCIEIESLKNQLREAKEELEVLEEVLKDKTRRLAKCLGGRI